MIINLTFHWTSCQGTCDQHNLVVNGSCGVWPLSSLRQPDLWCVAIGSFTDSCSAPCCLLCVLHLEPQSGVSCAVRSFRLQCYGGEFGPRLSPVFDSASCFCLQMVRLRMRVDTGVIMFHNKAFPFSRYVHDQRMLYLFLYILTAEQRYVFKAFDVDTTSWRPAVLRQAL